MSTRVASPKLADGTDVSKLTGHSLAVLALDAARKTTDIAMGAHALATTNAGRFVDISGKYTIIIQSLAEILALLQQLVTLLAAQAAHQATSSPPEADVDDVISSREPA